MATRRGTVYTLTDPRDRSVRYVGKTTQPLLERLAGHLASPTNPAMRMWINTLGRQGLAPHIEPIATVPADKLSAEEDRLIRQYAKDGHRLLNAPYYQRNLADLFAPMKKAKSAADAQFDAACHRLYGPIASARAAGKMSRPAAALRVVLLAPVMGVLLIAFTVFYSRTSRTLAWLSAGCWYAWDIGFDRLVRDYVLVHVPGPELVAFWHTYLAGPLATLGQHLLVVLLLMTFAVYSRAADAAGVGRVRPGASKTAKAPGGSVLPGVTPSPAVRGLVTQRAPKP